MKDIFKHEKDSFFKKEKISLFKDKKPRLNYKSYTRKDDFTPERALKLAGSVALLGVGINLISNAGGSN